METQLAQAGDGGERARVWSDAAVRRAAEAMREAGLLDTHIAADALADRPELWLPESARAELPAAMLRSDNGQRRAGSYEVRSPDSSI